MKNGTKKPALAAVPAPKTGDRVLTPKQKAELDDIERRAVLVKCAISDLTEQLIVGERRRHSMFDELYKLQDEYRTKCNKFAAQHGIDVDADPKVTGERFEYVATQGRFTRHEVPVEAPAPEVKAE
jgi:hypothetical protein